VHGSAVSWELSTASIVAGAATVVVLALLWRLRLEDAAMRRVLVRVTAQSQEQQAQLEQRAIDASKRAVYLSKRATEISELSAKVADLHESEKRLRGECAEMQIGNVGLQERAKALHLAVRHTFAERIPAALAGTPVPAAEDDGVDAEMAKLLDEAATGAATFGDQQDSMRAAVVALARRVQASAHRIQEEANLMADRHPGDAGVLEVSMRVDHAAAQQARHAQSVAVLCGEWPGQQWPEPLPLVDVVRAAAGRIIAYQRVEVAGDQDIAASAPIVEPVIHLVAELLANATQSSPPATKVPVTVRAVQRGAVIEVHDCGVGLDDYRLTQAREIASGGRIIGLDDLGEFPQTGLAVVGQYVRRHGLRVDISESVYGGVRAVVGIPAGLIETVAPADVVPAPTDPAAPAADREITAKTETSPESVAKSGNSTKAESSVKTAEVSANATATDQRRKGLPRRHSPRRDSSARNKGSEPEGFPRRGSSPRTDGSPANDAASPARSDEPVSAQPTPQEAGAWMGAFLNSNDDSGQEQ
jgi:signal transduction histidine kinase